MSLNSIQNSFFFGMVGGRYTGWLRMKWIESGRAVENMQKAPNRLDSPRARFPRPSELQWLGQIEHIDLNSMTRTWPLKYHSPVTKSNRSLQQTLDNTGTWVLHMCPSQMCNYWWTSWAFYGLLASPGCLCSFGFHHGRCLSCCRGFIAYQVTGFYQIQKFTSFQKKNLLPVSCGQEASAGPASALAQWHGGLRDAGAAALQSSSPHPD